MKFETVWRFISKKANRESTVQEVHEATGVEEKLIFRWIQEGRLLVKNFANLAYPCSSCGTMIQQGKLCPDCVKKIQSDLESYEKQEDFRHKDTHYQTYKLDR
ncbi:ribosomal protein L32 [Pullulanibacillus pueri]|nr:ribosomal protein L32 [Pullulanibacillus pueri]